MKRLSVEASLHRYLDRYLLPVPTARRIWVTKLSVRQSQTREHPTSTKTQIHFASQHDLLQSANMDIPVHVVEPLSAHTHTVVFLHGRGDNAPNFAASLRFSRTSADLTLFQALPSFRWVFPQARRGNVPARRPCGRSVCPPPSAAGGASADHGGCKGFDVWNVGDFAEREELQAEGLKEVVPALRRVLAAEAARLGGRWDKVVLAGISMGGATSAHILFNLDVPGPRPRLAAFLGFSCRCPFAGRALADMRAVLHLDAVPGHPEVVRNTPVLLEHCGDDPLVLVGSGRGLRDTLVEFGASVEWREYPAGGHWFNATTGMDDVVEFVKRAVEPSVEGEGTTVEASEMDLS